MENSKNALISAIEELYGLANYDIELSRPDNQFGDYSTNVAMRLSKLLAKSPIQIATEILDLIISKKYSWLKKVEIAGPGFINLYISDLYLFNSWSLDSPKVYSDQVVVAEYSDPNPFKALHAGHLYTTLVGNAVANLCESAGAKVIRLNYGGDVGLHVARAMFGIINYLGGEFPEKLEQVKSSDRSNWISERYVEGNLAYETSEDSKQLIININTKVYDIHKNGDTESNFAKIYWICRGWSYEGFEKLYKELSVSAFDEFIPESKVTQIGINLVKEGLLTGVFVESEGAIVFKGEEYDLHTRVFINSNGLPLYEAKELGLAKYKWDKCHFDKSVVITGNDIVEYMKVVFKAMENFNPESSSRTNHLTHGMIKLSGGKKMSSRTGNVLMANDIINSAKQANLEMSGKEDDSVAIGAIKYAFLKQRLGGDIIYDPIESISLQGNSGPYLQYSHARAMSILEKSTDRTDFEVDNLTEHERLLASILLDYGQTVQKATLELMPHHICTYLYELAQVFNRFYENSKVIGDERQPIRIELVKRYADTLKAGLNILGISAPDKM